MRLKRVATGYGRLVRNISKLLAVCVLIGIGSAIIAYPLWFLAVKHTKAYTLLCLSLIVLLILSSIFRSIQKRLQGERNPLHALAALGFLVLKRTGLIIGVMILIYGLAILYLNRWYPFAILGTLAALILVGYAVYGKRGYSGEER